VKNYQLVIHPKDEERPYWRAEVSGFLDSHTVIDFEESLGDLANEESPHVILDLSRLAYISSSGISGLMHITHQLRSRSGDLVLLSPTDKVQRVLQTLGFTKILRIIENESEAKTAFT
jgi:anti-sigma B factor antagonist